MNERLKYPVVITAICIIAAAGLAFTFAVTKDRIAASKEKDLEEGFAIALPKDRASIVKRPLQGANPSDPAYRRTLYVAVGKAQEDLAYAAVGSAKGYSSNIEVLAGVTPDYRVIGIFILAQAETPGLGERSRETPPAKSIWRAIADAFSPPAKDEGQRDLTPRFQKQFQNKTQDQLRLTPKPDSKSEISQLTGATITSRAVVNAVRDAINKIEATRNAKPAATPEPDHKAP